MGVAVVVAGLLLEAIVITVPKTTIHNKLFRITLHLLVVVGVVDVVVIKQCLLGCLVNNSKVVTDLPVLEEEQVVLSTIIMLHRNRTMMLVWEEVVVVV